jgi:SAM-dependent methyltransferase
MMPCMSDVAAARWQQVLSILAAALADDPRNVMVDGFDHAPDFADRLAAALEAAGSTTKVAAVNGGPANPGDLLLWLRTPPVPARASLEREAAVVVDLHDPTWPVLRHIDESLAPRRSWYLSETRAFFAVRAATWDSKFGDDAPAYAAAVAQAEVPVGGRVIDVGCGTGRALPALHAAVGPAGLVVGLDVTEEMLSAARSSGRAARTGLVHADARHLPLAAGVVDAVFAAGLIGHVPDVDPVLGEFARVTRPGGRLALFHPSGRAALAARHGRALRHDEPLAPAPLGAALARTGWDLVRHDDGADRFLALAVRCGQS